MHYIQCENIPIDRTDGQMARTCSLLVVLTLNKRDKIPFDKFGRIEAIDVSKNLPFNPCFILDQFQRLLVQL